MFACPNCRTRLAKELSAEGPRWVCAACGGRAVHLPSLRGTRPGAFIRRLWALACSAPPAERKRACPLCGSLMATVPTLAVPGSAEPLQLDICVSCQFVWFDPTEHQAWVSSSWTSSEEQLPAETRAALARLPPAAVPVLAIDSDASDRMFQRVPSSAEFEWKYVMCLLGLPVAVDPPPLLFFDLRVSGALVLWLIVQLIGAIVQAARGTQVAYFAHVGGALAGLIFWWINGRGGTARLTVARAARR
jgi:hypothetical protein